MTMTADQVFPSASNEPLTIRPYEAQDQPAVRELFIRVNRELAPAHMKEQFEAYIALSLREEIDRIPAYDAARAEQASGLRLISMGLSGPLASSRSTPVLNCGACTLTQDPAAKGWAASCGLMRSALPGSRATPGSCSARQSFSRPRSCSTARPAIT
jgi:hypothetical protein